MRKLLRLSQNLRCLQNQCPSQILLRKLLMRKLMRPSRDLQYLQNQCPSQILSWFLNRSLKK